MTEDWDILRREARFRSVACESRGNFVEVSAMAVLEHVTRASVFNCLTQSILMLLRHFGLLCVEL